MNKSTMMNKEIFIAYLLIKKSEQRVFPPVSEKKCKTNEDRLLQKRMGKTENK